MVKLIKKSDFAKLANINKSTVSRIFKTALKEAVIGKNIDIDSPAVTKYLKKKGIKKSSLKIKEIPVTEVKLDTSTKSKVTNKQNAPEYPIKNINNTIENIEDEEKAFYIPEYARDFLDWKLRDIFLRFATETAFLDFLKSTKAIHDIEEKQIKNAQIKGELISKKLVEIAVIDPVDTIHKRLLTDSVVTITSRVISMFSAGEDKKDIEKYVYKYLKTEVSGLKRKIQNNINHNIHISEQEIGNDT